MRFWLKVALVVPFYGLVWVMAGWSGSDWQTWVLIPAVAALLTLNSKIEERWPHD